MKSLVSFDVVGTTKFAVTDSEVLKVTLEILHSLNLKKSQNKRFVIRINHSSIFRALMQHYGVDEEDIPFVVDILRDRIKLGHQSSKVSHLLERKKILPQSIAQIVNLLSTDRDDAMNVHQNMQRRIGSLPTIREALGVISSIVNFGAFVDLGGVDGLVHVSELSWKHIDHPSEVVEVGDEVKIMLNFDIFRKAHKPLYSGMKYEIEKKTINKKDVLKLKLAPGGGCAIILKQLK